MAAPFFLTLFHWGWKSYIPSKVNMAEAANQQGGIFYKEGEFAKWVISWLVLVFLYLNTSLEHKNATNKYSASFFIILILTLF